MAVLGRLGNMKGVSTGAVGYNLGQDTSPPLLSVGKAFQDKEAGAFADNETVAFRIEGTGGLLWFIIPGRDGLEGIEGGDTQGIDYGLTAAGYRRLGTPPFDEFVGHPDSIGAAGAG